MRVGDQDLGHEAGRDAQPGQYRGRLGQPGPAAPGPPAAENPVSTMMTRLPSRMTQK
jgi:hypothetical protein